MVRKLSPKGTENTLMKGYVREATHADIQLVAQDMRDADVAEVMASSGWTSEQALINGLQTRETGGIIKTICLPNDLPVGMFGVVPVGTPEVGAIWMLASNGLQAIHRQFARQCRSEIDQIAEGYRLIFNFTDARNSLHHRWLQWSGFTIIKRHERYGHEQRPFLEFVKVTEKHDV